ncbi:single-stranded DNA-binding protein [Rhizocola hellebori]|uniref:Single-stranded DNA-binding protein n=1 Tax=Rhizocola hellebori TaxID=1392758 RepID=A0A8J3Q3R8_9ACTN|nr:single-stranded DNA-binding protein [Rhizocola hellebori]GIH03393.1 single-stranded DNA-binding protein [Rhizocola hellebori]
MSNETVLTMVGNLTGEPDLRFLPNGAACCKFTVASTPRVYDKASGEYRDGESLFMNCTAWRELAEHAAESLAKGMRVVVVGRLRLSKWETDDGEKRSMYQLDVEEVAPSLRFATAKVAKMSRSKGDGFLPTNVPDDAWDTATSTRPLVAA